MLSFPSFAAHSSLLILSVSFIISSRNLAVSSVTLRPVLLSICPMYQLFVCFCLVTSVFLSHFFHATLPQPRFVNCVRLRSFSCCPSVHSCLAYLFALVYPYLTFLRTFSNFFWHLHIVLVLAFYPCPSCVIDFLHDLYGVFILAFKFRVSVLIVSFCDLFPPSSLTADSYITTHFPVTIFDLLKSCCEHLVPPEEP